MPLYSLTTKTAPDTITWNSELNTAFETLRSALTSDSILLAPDFNKTFTLTTDASYNGVGAVLSQPDAENFHKPIAFYSKKLSKSEKNYSVTEIELLALVEAVEHFKLYLLGAPFVVITDHKALLALDRLITANKRLTRWSLILANYNFTVTYKPGSLNTNADALSRQDWPEEPQDSEDSEEPEEENEEEFPEEDLQ